MKTAQIHLLTSLGYDVVFNDVDVAWHRDVRPTLEFSLERPDADVLFLRNCPLNPAVYWSGTF